MNQAIGGVLQPAGPVAEGVAGLAWLLIVGATLVFVIVMVLLAWALSKHPTALDDRRMMRRWIIGGGIAFPTVVLASLLVHVTRQSHTLTLSGALGRDVITVVAKSWWWEVRYRDPASDQDVVLANEIHVPVGRPVTLGLTSDDVIHSLWVPALAGKIDMLPGRVHQLRLQADRAGVYRGQCAEFCGTQHARMALHVVAHEPADYELWLTAQAMPATTPTDPQAAQGLRVFIEQRCGACHNIRGLSSGMALGPDLTHVGARLHLGAGTLRNGRESLAQWVSHNQDLKPGLRMPDYAQLDDSSLQALAVFLHQLK
ncbi:MAG: c-type cytochrome [Pseudomonadota bacterium]